MGQYQKLPCDILHYANYYYTSQKSDMGILPMTMYIHSNHTFKDLRHDYWLGL